MPPVAQQPPTRTLMATAPSRTRAASSPGRGGVQNVRRALHRLRRRWAAHSPAAPFCLAEEVEPGVTIADFCVEFLLTHRTRRAAATAPPPPPPPPARPRLSPWVRRLRSRTAPPAPPSAAP